MISPIAPFLPEFSSPLTSLGPGSEPPPDEDGFEMPVEMEAPAADLETQFADARAEGFAEGSATLETALASQAAELEAQHALALEMAQGEWMAAAADQFSDMLQSAIEDLERRLADGVADVLEPALNGAMRRRVAEELRQALASLLATGQGAVIRLSGPADLVEPLRVAFEGRAVIEAQATEANEIEIESDGTLIRSQLGPWAETLRSSLEEGL